MNLVLLGEVLFSRRKKKKKKTFVVLEFETTESNQKFQTLCLAIAVDHGLLDFKIQR